MPLAEIRKETERRMVVSIDALKAELKHLRTGRASVGLLEGVHVEYYGTATPLNQVANLSTPDATLILIQPWEAQLCPVIEKAIRNSDLGLNPSSDGRVVRVPVPSPTEERRKELVKKAHTLGEQSKVEIRHHRHEANDKVKKEGKSATISADEEKRALEDVQKLTDRFVAEVDTVIKAKETDILAR
ncbi:MAG: ribosome recycling factor [Holophagales bacterium]|jgi:ribosome recycling factor|nr:ribosome recycling factor [Holophagales bacterium]